MTEQIRNTAARCFQWNANVLAIRPHGSKRPLHKWKHFHTHRQAKDEAAALPWRKAGGVGVVSGIGAWRCIDLDDCETFTPVERILDELGLPHSYRWVVKSGSGRGWHIWIRCREELPADLLTAKKKEPGVRTGLPTDGLAFDHLELRWERCQTLLPPSLHEEGGRYAFYNGAPTAPPAEVPVERVTAAAVAVCREAEKRTPPKKSAGQNGRAERTDDLKERIKAALTANGSERLIAYAQQRFGGETQKEPNGDIRILGNGGLLIIPETGLWNIRREEIGGDCLDLIGYAEHGAAWDNNDKPMFREMLRIAADVAGVQMNGRSDATTSADIENAESFEWPEPVPLTPVRGAPLPLPVEVLPDWLRIFIESHAAFLQVPVALPFSLALAAVAGAVQKKAVVAVRYGYTEPLTLWTAPVLASGERKTPAFGRITAPVTAFERKERDRVEPERQRALDEREILEARLKEAKRQAVKATGAERQKAKANVKAAREELEAHVVPGLPTLWTDDTTPESLGKDMQANSGRIIAMSAEGDLFKFMAGRYQRNSSLGIYKKGWSGGEAFRDSRMGRDGVDIPDPALTVALCVQPEVLEHLAKKDSFRGEGILARFLFAVPRPMVGHRKTGPDVPPLCRRAANRYLQNMTRLLRLRPQAVEEGEWTPHPLELSEEARRVRWDFEAEIEKQVAPGGRLRHLRDWGGKIVGQAVRIAGLLHVADQLDFTGEISGQTMRRAAEIGRAYIEHALRAFDLLEANPRLRLARYVWERIQERRPDTRRELWEAAKGKSELSSAADLDDPLALLQEHDLIRVVNQKREGPGRSPSPRIEVNPKALEKTTPPHSQYSQNSQNGGREGNSANTANIENTPSPEENAASINNGHTPTDSTEHVPTTYNGIQHAGDSDTTQAAAFDLDDRVRTPAFEGNICDTDPDDAGRLPVRPDTDVFGEGVRYFHPHEIEPLEHQRS